MIPPGLPKQWHPPGIELITDNTLTPQQLDELDGAITGAAAGIAESGPSRSTAPQTKGAGHLH